MQDKHKVTLYLPPKLHRQLKIRSAVDAESMSTMVEKAIVFYLNHPEVVDEVEASYGNTHRVYACPECDSSLAIQKGELISLLNQPGVLVEELPANNLTESQGEEQLVLAK